MPKWLIHIHAPWSEPVGGNLEGLDAKLKNRLMREGGGEPTQVAIASARMRPARLAIAGLQI